MVYLLLSVFFTTTVFLILKEFHRYQLNNFQAIVVNYFIAFLMGSFFGHSPVSVSFYLDKSWVWGAVGISIIFIIVFNLMAVTAQKGGLSVMTVANKMSVVIPVCLGLFLYKESVGLLKVVGILLALTGVWLMTQKKSDQLFDKKLWYLPILIFFGSGLADALINHMQSYHVPSQELAFFSTSLFLFCGLIGFLIFAIGLFLGSIKISVKSWLGGLILGFPNYFSIYYLLKALSQPSYETSLMFSVNNLLVVFCSVALGVFIYKEKLSTRNIVGLMMSFVAIVLLYFTV